MSKEHQAKWPEVYKIFINGEDYSLIVEQAQVFQEIFFPFWTAQILITDSNNQIMKKGLGPGDKVNIKLGSREGKADYNFIIYKIGEREMIKQNIVQYEIRCIAKEFFDDAKKRVSKSINSKCASDIAS